LQEKLSELSARKTEGSRGTAAQKKTLTGDDGVSVMKASITSQRQSTEHLRERNSEAIIVISFIKLVDRVGNENYMKGYCSRQR